MTTDTNSLLLRARMMIAEAAPGAFHNGVTGPNGCEEGDVMAGLLVQDIDAVLANQPTSDVLSDDYGMWRCCGCGGTKVWRPALKDGPPITGDIGELLAGKQPPTNVGEIARLRAVLETILGRTEDLWTEEQCRAALGERREEPYMTLDESIALHNEDCDVPARGPV